LFIIHACTCSCCFVRVQMNMLRRLQGTAAPPCSELSQSPQHHHQSAAVSLQTQHTAAQWRHRHVTHWPTNQVPRIHLSVLLSNSSRCVCAMRNDCRRTHLLSHYSSCFSHSRVMTVCFSRLYVVFHQIFTERLKFIDILTNRFDRLLNIRLLPSMKV